MKVRHVDLKVFLFFLSLNNFFSFSFLLPFLLFFSSAASFFQYLTVEKELRKTNKVAPIIHTTQCDVDIAKIINVGAFNLDQVLEMDPEFLDPDSEHQHDATVVSVGIRCPGNCKYFYFCLNIYLFFLLLFIFFAHFFSFFSFAFQHRKINFYMFLSLSLLTHLSQHNR